MRTEAEIRQALADIEAVYNDDFLGDASRRDLACMGGMLGWVLGGEDWGLLDDIRSYLVRKETPQ